MLSSGRPNAIAENTSDVFIIPTSLMHGSAAEYCTCYCLSVCLPKYVAFLCRFNVYIVQVILT